MFGYCGAMRAWVVIATVVVAVLGFGCSGSVSTADSQVAADVIDTHGAETVVTPDAMPPGRERIAANEAAGKPYVLWFWGAN